MESKIGRLQTFENIMAFIIILAILFYLPFKIYSIGYTPTDDSNRHVVFSMADRTWEDILTIDKGLESDHNAGWHFFLRLIHKVFSLNKLELLFFASISLFILFNMAGIMISPNKAAWFVTLMIIFIVQKDFFGRLLCGRPFLISCAATLILLKYWFLPVKEDEKPISKSKIYIISIVSLTLSVWLHGSWYIFLLLPASLLLAGQIKKSLELGFLILVSTLIGAYLTGEFKEFLNFHFSATFNIFTERVYNWQLVSEFAEGDISSFWLIVCFSVIILLLKTNRLKLNELSREPIFIGILLSWLASIKVIRFWVDWGNIFFMFWLTYKLSDLIKLMESTKKTFFRWFLFLFILISNAILIPQANWDQRKERQGKIADFSKMELSDYRPDDGGIVYNDSMATFYLNYFENPDARYRYVIGFEPAIVPAENRSVFRDIVYTDFHFKSYEPWIKKLTNKDRIFTTVDISKNYPQLDWIKAANKLWIGKLPKQHEE